MRRSRLGVCLAAAGLLAVGGTGCGRWPPEVQLTPGFAGPESEYGRALARFTRHVELYEGFDTVAKGWATWRTAELRRAAAEASIRAYGLKGAAAEDLLEESATAARRAREFHLALYMPSKGLNDLESPNSLWRLSVELPDGSRLAPVQVVYLRKNEKTEVEYPYVSPWTREYSVTFPLPEGDETFGHLALVILGPPGKMRFEF
jgi:hypothetical protein